MLPGFWIEAGWLFAEPLPSTMACLRETLGYRAAPERELTSRS